MEPIRAGKLFDVVAVTFETRRVRVIAENKSLSNADAIVNMAVVRRGVDSEFYKVVEAGAYKEGDAL